MLESVIALSIISICMYIAILIFATVFTPRTSAKFYATQNSINAVFFQAQVNKDSLLQSDQMQFEEEQLEGSLKKITVRYKDSMKVEYEKSFYVQGQ